MMSKLRQFRQQQQRHQPISPQFKWQMDCIKVSEENTLHQRLFLRAFSWKFWQLIFSFIFRHSPKTLYFAISFHHRKHSFQTFDSFKQIEPYAWVTIEWITTNLHIFMFPRSFAVHPFKFPVCCFDNPERFVFRPKQIFNKNLHNEFVYDSFASTHTHTVH